MGAERVFTYHHYHSTSREVLVLLGAPHVVFGSLEETTVEIGAGEVILTLAG